MKTWYDVEKAALNDPILHAAVTLVRQGSFTREQALLEAVLALSEVNDIQRAQLLTFIMDRPVVRMQ